MIDELTAVFKSMTKALDVLYVIEDVKGVSRIMAEDINEYKAVFDQHGLKFVVSDFKISKEIDENQFSNKGVKSKEGSSFVYISKSKDKAVEAKKAEADGDHKKLGRLLGYPDCCIDFFVKEFPKQSKGKNDYVLASLDESEGFVFPFYNNVAARHLDLALISHFPCNLKCSKSVEIAEQNLKIIAKHSTDIARVINGMLKSGVLYTDNGIFLLRDHRLENNNISYNKIFSDVSNDFYKRLKNSNKIRIINKNTIELDNDKIENVGVMVFI